jgi:cell wall-associated NlpC family hydrolase
MSAPFFESDERQEALRVAAFSWQGTPFHPKAQIKGVGADCVSLARGIYAECGFHPEQPFPEYSMSEGSQTSKVQTFLDGDALFEKVWESDRTHRLQNAGCRDCTSRFGQMKLPTEPGDLICIRIARVSHHVGLMIGERMFIQTYYPYRAKLYTITDPTWWHRLMAIYRPLQPQTP